MLSFVVEGALEQLANILPDYILPFGITVLAHSEYLDDTTSMEQLAEAEKCLKFILDPMIRNKDTFCFSLYKNMIQKMKNSKSAFQPMNDQVNEVRICIVISNAQFNLIIFISLQKIWTLCDLAFHIIVTKLNSVDMLEYSLDQVNIPRMYFQEQPNDFDNKTSYLSAEYKRKMEMSVSSGAGTKRQSSHADTLELVKKIKNNASS